MNKTEKARVERDCRAAPKSVWLSQSVGIAFVEMDGDGVLLRESDGAYFGLTSSATELWKLVAQPRTIANLHQSLAELFEVTPEQAEEDVIAFAVDMISSNLVSCQHK